MTDWSRIHENRASSMSTAALVALSHVYGSGLRIWIKLRERRGKNKLPGFVLSVGNLTAGGTGKTPAAAMIAEWALKAGFRPAILSRGYGGRYKAEAFEVCDGQHLFCTPAEAGDEPYLLAKKLPGVPVVLSKARYKAGLLAFERHGSNFFILDDGFQHLRLQRDLDLVLLDATNPFGNMRLLPAGPLREPLEHLQRADGFILTRAGRGTSLIMMNYLKRKFRGKPVFQSEHVPERLVLPNLDHVHSPDYIRGKRVVAFAGIAKPEGFRETLLALGARIAFFRAFRDHHRFALSEFQDLVAEKQKLGADLLVTTEKDYVRLGQLAPTENHLGYLTIRFQILSGADAFFDMIRGKAREACWTPSTTD